MNDSHIKKSSPTGGRKRLRELGIRIGRMSTGRYNSITDVPGVKVGHSTLIRPASKLKGPARTGVTAILPNDGNVFTERVVGGGFVLNGAGEVSGLTQTMEWGLIETPILLTNTLSVGTCSEACVDYMLRKHPGIGVKHDVVIPLVGECDDSFLNDIGGQHVRPEHVFQALESASYGTIPEGNVGGGTGMITGDFKGGIGTSSRRLPLELGGFKVGVLVMSNFGHMEDMRLDGVPVGKLLSPKFSVEMRRKQNYGSIIAVIATDAPLLTHQLNRIAKRVALGIGRAGSYAAHGSGEIILAFSSANKVPRETKKMLYRMTALLDTSMNPLYQAAMEATEEAIWNALCMGEAMSGVGGNSCPALPLDEVQRIMKEYRRLEENLQLAP